VTGAKLKKTFAILGLAAGLAVFTAMAAETAKPPPSSSSGTSSPPAGTTAIPPAHSTPTAKKPEPAKPEKKVDLNNASKAELMTLPSVGESEAAKIIANRPYFSKVDLVTKAGLPEGVYFAVRHKVVAGEMKKKPEGKTATAPK
jgi:DNA uptake protein ComE-like DNA-binding protein